MTSADGPFVVVVARGVPSPSSPLLGCFELDQARALAAAGATVVVAALDVRSARRRRRWGFSSQVDSPGVPIEVLSVPLGALPVRLNQLAMGLAWRLLYRRVVARHGRPDVVHAHFTSWGAAVAHHTPRGPQMVVTEHNSRLTAATIPTSLRWQARRAYVVDHVVAVSRSLAEVMRREFGVDATVIGDVIDVDHFVPGPRQVHRGVRLISTGNLIPRKRMDLLLEGFALLAVSRDDVSLTIVGQGPQLADLEKQAADLGLLGAAGEAAEGDRVRFLGRTTRDELAALYRSHDAFVLLSRHETFGVVWAEALAAGLPVLAPRIPGPDEYVDESVGEWTGETPEEVAAALVRLIDRLPDFDPDVLRAQVSSRFSPAAVAQQLLALYATPPPRRTVWETRLDES